MGFWGFGVLGFWGFGVLGFWGFGVLGFWGFGVLGFWGFGVLGFWGFGVLGFWGFGVLGFWGFGVLGFWGFGVLGFWGFGVLGFWGFGVFQEKSFNYKILISPLEDKIRNLDRDYQSEKLKILALSNQHSNLSLKINEHIQNFTFFQSQTKVHNEKEEVNSWESKIETHKLIEKCQIDLREIRSIIESHNGAINFLNDQFEATRQEILSLKGACGKLESVLNNVNSDFQSLLENQKNTFMQRIKETVDTLDSNAEQFQNRLILEAQKTDERFNRLDENISNLLRNSLHISRSFEEERREQRAR